MKYIIVCIVFFLGFSNAMLGQSSEVKLAYNNAVQLFSAKDYAGAVQLLEGIAESEPDFLEGQRLMAECHKGLKNEAQTQKYYKRVLDIQPNQPDVWYSYALSHVREGNDAEAQAALEKLLELKPNDKKAQNLMARFQETPTEQHATHVVPASYDSGNSKNEVKEKTKPNKTNNTTISAAAKKYANKGIGYYNEKQFDEASMAFDEAVKSGNGSAKLYSYAGRSHMHTGETEKAIEYLKKAIAKDSENGEYHYYLSKAFELKGMKTLQDKYANMASSRGFSPTAEVFNSKGIEYYNEGIDFYHAKNYSAAVTSYQRAIQENPNKAHYHYNLAATFYAMKHFKDAKSSLKNAIETDPTYPNSHKLMGDVLYGTGDYRKAASHYDEAIALGLNTYNAYLNVGYCFDKLNAHKKALEYFLKAEEKNPSHQEVIFTVATTYFKANMLTEAKNKFAALFELDKTNIRVLTNISNICGRMGQFEEGLKYAMMWIEIDSNDGEAYSQAGDMLLNLGRGDEADKYKRKAKSLGVNRDPIHY